MSIERSRRRPRAGLVASVAAALIASCSGEQHGASHPLQPLPESRALEVIASGFQEAGATPELHRSIQVAGNRTLEIDMATAGHPHGVEYVTAQDRLDLGDAIPRRQTAGSLLTLTGSGSDSGTDVLVLDDREFLYQSDPDESGPGNPTLVEVEDRLRRAVIDYLSYLRQHGEM